MRLHGKIDSTQRAVVSALRQVGATVESLANVGGGVPDLLVGYRGTNYLLEVKAPKGKLTPQQKGFHLLWRGSVQTVYSVDQALAVIGVKIT